MSELQRAIRALADEWSRNIGQGSGHYLNPRAVVDRLDAALESEAAPTPSSYDKLIEAGWITPEMCAERVAQAEARAGRKAAHAWDEGVRHAESCRGGKECDPRTANPYRDASDPAYVAHTPTRWDA